ncbi:MAG: hypothetical protein NTW19_00920 [Planctomycetota bacterium]|nr:hypothetical protein [Planctomycetota bacterium]
MRGSTLLPWLFFGPLLLAIVANLLFRVTGWPWAGHVAQGAVIVTLAALLAAFVPNFLWFWRSRGRGKGSEKGPPFP